MSLANAFSKYLFIQKCFKVQTEHRVKMKNDFNKETKENKERTFQLSMSALSGKKQQKNKQT